MTGYPNCGYKNMTKITIDGDANKVNNWIDELVKILILAPTYDVNSITNCSLVMESRYNTEVGATIGSLYIWYFNDDVIFISCPVHFEPVHIAWVNEIQWAIGISTDNNLPIIFSPDQQYIMQQFFGRSVKWNSVPLDHLNNLLLSTVSILK